MAESTARADTQIVGAVIVFTPNTETFSAGVLLPAEYLSNMVRHVEARHKAYEIAPRDKLYLKPEDGVGIW